MSDFSEILKQLEIYDYSRFTGCYIYNYSLIHWCEIISKKYLSVFSDHDRILTGIFLPGSIKELERKLTGPAFNAEFYTLKNNSLLKPTSEFSLYPSHFFRKKIKTYNQLPVKFTLINPVFRNQSRTKPLFRHNQINYFIESHTTNITSCDTDLKNAINKYKQILRFLNIPFFLVKRTEENKFQGAKTTYAFETYISATGKTLQIATIHDLHKNYSVLLDLKTKNKHNSFEYVNQISYGMSAERLVASLLFHNSHKNQLRLPSRFRLKELILYCCEKPSYFRFKVDKVHYISRSKQYIKLKNILRTKDSIIYTIGPKQITNKTYIIENRENRQTSLCFVKNKIKDTHPKNFIVPVFVYKHEFENLVLQDKVYKTRTCNLKNVKELLSANPDYILNGTSLCNEYLYFSKTY